VSIISDPTGEAALAYLPARGADGDELRFYAAQAQRVDATIAVALRSCIEHFGQYMRIAVRLAEVPADQSTWRALDALLGANMPSTFSVGQATASGPPPTTVILPALRIDSYDIADRVTDAIVEPLGAHYHPKVMRYIAGSFAALVENGLQHAEGSTVGVVSAIAYDRDTDEVRLAVTDTGESLSSSTDSDGALNEALESSRENEGGLEDLAARVSIAQREVAITLASGTARARSDGGPWTSELGEHLDGFTAIVSVRAH
jgi:hypothetical protein